MLLAYRRRRRRCSRSTIPRMRGRFAAHRRAAQRRASAASSTSAHEEAWPGRRPRPLLRPLDHPRGAPRRYDTRFFVAPAPPGQVPAPRRRRDGRHRLGPRRPRRCGATAQGEFELIFPTIEQPAGHRPLPEQPPSCWRRPRPSSAVPAIVPRVVADGRGVRIVLPGDPGYDEACRRWRPWTRRTAPGRCRRPTGRGPTHRSGGPDRTGRRPRCRSRARSPCRPSPSTWLPRWSGSRRPTRGLMTGPGHQHLPASGRDELAVVDPGPDIAGHLDALVRRWPARRAASAGSLVTHTHPDHAPGAAGLAARTGRRGVGFGARDGFVPDRRVGDGWTLPRRRLRAAGRAHAGPRLQPPVLAARGAGASCFSGDHVMQGRRWSSARPTATWPPTSPACGGSCDLTPPVRRHRPRATAG